MKVIRIGDKEALELFESDLANALNVPATIIRQAQDLIPSAGKKENPVRQRLEAYYICDRQRLKQWHIYAQLLNKGMTPAQIKEVEERDRALRAKGVRSRMLESYATLAQECPEGITPHILRTYYILYILQPRLRRAPRIDELAYAAGLSEQTVHRHLLILLRMGFIRVRETSDGRKIFEFLYTPRGIRHNHQY